MLITTNDITRLLYIELTKSKDVDCPGNCFNIEIGKTTRRQTLFHLCLQTIIQWLNNKANLTTEIFSRITTI
jgi:hypothetical protein